MANDQSVTTDLNATIASAVSARVEAEVAAALSGDEFIGQYVHAALTQQVPISHDRYENKKAPYLTVLLRRTIQKATEAAVERLLEEERPLIEDEIRKALRRNAATMAEGIASSLSERASRGYGVTVALRLPGEYS